MPTRRYGANHRTLRAGRRRISRRPRQVLSHLPRQVTLSWASTTRNPRSSSSPAAYRRRSRRHEGAALASLSRPPIRAAVMELELAAWFHWKLPRSRSGCGQTLLHQPFSSQTRFGRVRFAWFQETANSTSCIICTQTQPHSYRLLPGRVKREGSALPLSRGILLTHSRDLALGRGLAGLQLLGCGLLGFLGLTA